MLDVAVQECRRAGFSDVAVVASGPDLPDHLVLGDGLQLRDLHQFYCHDEAFLPELRVLSALAKASEVIIIGADILDESYSASLSHKFLRCAQWAAQLDVPTRIVGFSLSQVPSPSLAERFRRLSPPVRLFARDPVTQRRLTEAGIEGVELSADTAFLLPPAVSQSLPAAVRGFLAADARPGTGGGSA